MLRRLRWRLKQGKIFAFAAHPAPVSLAKAKAMELAEEKRTRCAMPLSWLIQIDNRYARAGLESRQKVKEQAVRLGDFVVHVHHEDKGYRTKRQAWIMRFAEHECYIGQMLLANPLTKFPQIRRHHILGQNPPSWPNPSRQADRIIACASPKVGNRHAGAYAEKIHDLLSLAIPVAGFFG